MSSLESICRVHATPKRDEAGLLVVSFKRRVKYEKLSIELSET